MPSPISQRSPLIPLSRIAATVHRVLTAQLFSGHTHLTNIGSMGRRTTDGIADCCVNCSIEVCAFRAEGVIAGHAQISARVPPTMLAYNNTRVKLIVQSGAYSHGSSRRLDIDPTPDDNFASRCSFRVEFHFRMERALTQAGYRSMLGLAEDTGLCACKHKRKSHLQLRSYRTRRRIHKVRQSRMTMLDEGLRPELNLARRGGESARITARVDICMFGMSRSQYYPHSPRLD